MIMIMLGIEKCGNVKEIETEELLQIVTIWFHIYENVWALQIDVGKET